MSWPEAIAFSVMFHLHRSGLRHRALAGRTMSPVVSTLRACRIREGTHHVPRIDKTDVEAAHDWHDLSIRELLNESLRAQHAGDARRGWLLATAAAARYRRQLREAREAV